MAIRTRSVRVGGFRRCGVRHLAEWTTWPEDQFSAEEIERLKADPAVIVEEVEGEAAGPQFASDIAAKRAADAGITLEQLRERGEPSGKGGYTTADVQAYLVFQDADNAPPNEPEQGWGEGEEFEAQKAGAAILGDSNTSEKP